MPTLTIFFETVLIYPLNSYFFKVSIFYFSMSEEIYISAAKLVTFLYLHLQPTGCNKERNQSKEEVGRERGKRGKR